MPPASRNHRAPTADDTPARAAASSLDCPAAIAAQNRCRSSRRAVGGRPSDPNTPRPARAEPRFRIFIATSSVEVLRRPPESTLYASGEYQDVLRRHGIRPSMSRKGDCWDHAVAESFFATLEWELIEASDWHTREEAHRAVAEFIEVWYNHQRLHSSLGYQTPAEYEQELVLTRRAA